MTKLSKKKIIKAIEGTGGVVQAVAERCKVTRKSIYEHLNSCPELWDYIKHERDKVGDLVEAEIIKQIKSGNWKAVKYYADRKLKDRGYTTRQEVEHLSKEPIKIEFHGKEEVEKD